MKSTQKKRKENSKQNSASIIKSKPTTRRAEVEGCSDSLRTIALK
jgi:hypothetical protein